MFAALLVVFQNSLFLWISDTKQHLDLLACEGDWRLRREKLYCSIEVNDLICCKIQPMAKIMGRKVC